MSRRIGDYITEQELGIEETGVVYLGKHAVLPRTAAVKVMHAGPEWVRAMAVRMLREACLVEALSHPGIPRVYECGVLADRRPWTAFEHIEGDSIGALIADAPMPLADVVVLVRDVADILDHIHRRGIVHRKLTADAVVRTNDRRFPVCLRFWGEACTLDAAAGTDAGTAIDARADVRELGAIAFRALTGSLPDAGSAHDRYPGAPLDVTALIDSMLATDPARRPSSAEVRDRAKWLADTLELVSVMDRPRWTPPGGLDPDAIPTPVQDAGSGFTIRIAGGRPRQR